MMNSWAETKFLNIETQEVMTGKEICEKVLEEEFLCKKQRFEWVKVYIRFLDYIEDIVNSPRFNVVFRFLKNLNLSSNEVGGSFSEIAKETGAGIATVKRVVGELYAHDYIRPVRNGRWMVNPNILYSGSEAKAKYLRTIYFNLKKCDRKPKIEKKEPEEFSELETRIIEAIETIERRNLSDD